MAEQELNKTAKAMSDGLPEGSSRTTSPAEVSPSSENYTPIANVMNSNPKMSETSIKCTADKPFLTEPCQCPECKQKQETDNKIITDKDLMTIDGSAVIEIKGLLFKCPHCNEYHIRPAFKGCPMCLKPVTVHSVIWTSIIKDGMHDKPDMWNTYIANNLPYQNNVKMN